MSLVGERLRNDSLWIGQESNELKDMRMMVMSRDEQPFEEEISQTFIHEQHILRQHQNGEKLE